MISGILAGVTWALETVILGIALAMTPFVSTEQAIILAPFASTFLHDSFSAVWAFAYNLIKGNIKNVFACLKKKGGLFVVVAAVIGGPVGMTGYVLAVNYMGASIGAIASAIFPAIGAALAFFFLKEKMSWYRWVFLIFTILGVFGLSFSPDLAIKDFWLGLLGAFMCSFGWGIEAVVLAKCMQDPEVKDEYALQIRQTTSAIVNGCIILPIVKGWKFTISLFATGETWLIPTIIIAALFATISYLFYYKAISTIGATKAMALNVSYSAWAILFTVIIVRDFSVLSPITILCAIVVLICGILAAGDYKELLKRVSN